MVVKFYVHNSYSEMTKIISLQNVNIVLNNSLTVTYNVYHSELNNCLHTFKYLFINKVIYSITFNTSNIVITKFQNVNWQLVIGVVSMFLETSFVTETLNLQYEESVLSCSQFNDNERLYMQLFQTKINEQFSSILNEHNGYITVKNINVTDSKFYVLIAGACSQCEFSKYSLEAAVCDICTQIFPTYSVIFM